ncbi:MAG: polysaccharide pyruvyl transferase family protein [Leptolyngbya sp. SIO4C1]|nr:polysaccharide pyruvyl transferase family protein [Leptolyngbya sp. SIO4C1]
MRLFYFKRNDGIENFGDSLNPWLWQQLIGNVLDEDETTAFIGIGTILNGCLPYRLPNARRFVVFSSGLGYGRGTIPALDSNWSVYCVRGPLTAQQLGLPDRLAIADGALLLRRVYRPAATKQYAYSYMPHVEQAIRQGEQWAEICDRAEIHYLDPRRPIEQLLTELSQTELLIAEAMHGAIAAEALRVPWIAVHSHPDIFRFKWIDWCRSLGLNYAPQALTPFGETDWPHSRDRLAQQLRAIARQTAPSLACDRTVETLTERLEAQLAQFRQDARLSSPSLSLAV